MGAARALDTMRAALHAACCEEVRSDISVFVCDTLRIYADAVSTPGADADEDAHVQAFAIACTLTLADAGGISMLAFHVSCSTQATDKQVPIAPDYCRRLKRAP